MAVALCCSGLAVAQKLAKYRQPETTTSANTCEAVAKIMQAQIAELSRLLDECPGSIKVFARPSRDRAREQIRVPMHARQALKDREGLSAEKE